MKKIHYRIIINLFVALVILVITYIFANFRIFKFDIFGINFFYISGLIVCLVMLLTVNREMDVVLDTVLPDKIKNDIDLYILKWNSKEFEEFIGEDLLEIYSDCKKINLIEYPGLSDYSFLVFPMAKVFEGILKKILVETGLINESDLLENPTLNVGAYFNPIGNDKIFTVLKDRARDKSIPYLIYSTYQECRNQILHYDVYRDNRIFSEYDAEFYNRRIIHAIEKTYETFKNNR